MKTIRVKFALNRKHPIGTIWVESGFGWSTIVGIDVRREFNLPDSIVTIEGEASVSEEQYDRFVAYTDEGPQAVIESSPTCGTCGD